ncbi:peptide deformylase [bacterium]|nr:peptide deformylase [bacterium]
MGKEDIITYGHETLRLQAKPVEVFGEELQHLADEMYQAMYAADGAGLAAPQVNRSIQFLIMAVPQKNGEPIRMQMANPRVTETRGNFEYEEGCLSVPDIRDMVTRPEWIRVEYQDTEGKARVIEADGLLARVIQHEVDHINGVLFVDRLTSARRARWDSALKKMAKSNVST